MSSGGLGLHQLGRVFISEVKRRALIHAQAHERPSTVAIKRRARANYDPMFISVQLTGFIYFFFAFSLLQQELVGGGGARSEAEMELSVDGCGGSCEFKFALVLALRP